MSGADADPLGLDGEATAPSTTVVSDGGDQLFVHGLASHLLDRGETVVNSRITAALAAIDSATVDHRSPRPVWRLLLAALLVAAPLLWLLWRGDARQDLQAAVQRAVAFAEQDIDRAYKLRIEVDATTARVGTMTVRGSERFVVAIELERGRFVFGCDGERSWAVPPLPRLPVRVAPGIGRAGETIAGDAPRLPFYSLARFLRDLPNDYELAPATGAGGDALVIAATPRARGNGEPIAVQATIEPSTGAVRELRLTWPMDRPTPSPLSVELELLRDAPLPDSFYRHDDHHAPGRPIVEFR
jgi:hypothetical protein